MKLVVLTLLTVLTLSVDAQYFTGEITYKTLAISHDENQVVLQPEESTYLVSESQYKTTVIDNNQNIITFTYNNLDNKIYDNDFSLPYITYRSSVDEKYIYEKPKIFRDSIKYIQGHECFMLKQESTGPTTTIYYSKEASLNYHNFAGHDYSNWYERQKLVEGAIPLKIIVSNGNESTIFEATSVTQRPVSKDEFKLADKPIIASGNVLDNPIKIQDLTDEQFDCYAETLSDFIILGKKRYTKISFMLTAEGEIKYIRPRIKDRYGFYKVALDVVKNCNLTYNQGTIDGIPVDCEVIIPITIK